MRTAVNLSDGAVARHSVWALSGSIERYVDHRPGLPAGWFVVEEEHFRGRHRLMLREVEETMTWMERRMLDAARLRSELGDLAQVTLVQIGQELITVDDRVFWELTDRVVNFDYLEEDLRVALPTFLQPIDSWLELAQPTTARSTSPPSAPVPAPRLPVG